MEEELRGLRLRNAIMIQRQLRDLAPTEEPMTTKLIGMEAAAIIDELGRIADSRKVVIEGLEARLQEARAKNQRMLDLYASSYSTMAKIGDGRVSCSGVAYDLRNNIIRQLV